MEINKPISTIIILIIALILFFFFVAPEYGKSENLQNNLGQKQAEYDGKSVYYAKVSELIASIESRTDALEKINSALSSDFSFAPIASFLQQKGVENGLTIQSIMFSQISPTTTNQKVKDVTFTVNVSGNYQGLKNFVSSLDTSARLFEVNSMNFSLSSPSIVSNDIKQSKNQQQTYSLKLEVVTHTY